MTMEKKVLLDHQAYALEIMAANEAVGIAYDMGTGKTAIALMHAYRGVQKRNVKRVLVVCPSNLVDNWHDKLDKLIEFEGVTPMGLKRLKEAIYITSFQKTYKSEKLPSGRRRLSLRPEVDKMWDIFFVDESQCIGAYNSLQTKAAYTIATHSKERYLLTGTPFHGGGGKEDYSKLYGQMRVIKPDIWRSWSEFCHKFVASYDRWNKPTSYRVADCKALIEKYWIVCRLEQVVDMPDKVDNELICPLAETKVYKDIRKGAIQEYDLNPETGGFSYVKLLQICSGSMKTEHDVMKFKTSKDDTLTDLINGTEDKVVIFYQFTASKDRIKEICEQNGRKVVEVNGSSEKGSWEKFQYGDATACIAQYKSGGPGLDLFASHTVIFFEPTLSALLYSQARGRVYRTGQTHTTLYYILCTPGTVEQKAWNTVRNGEDVSSKMLDQWAREEQF